MFKNKSYGYSDSSKFSKTKIILLLLAVAGLYFGYRQFINMTLNKANQAFQSGDRSTAEKLWARTANLPLSGGLGRDGLGALALLDGKQDAAKIHFLPILRHKPGGYGARPELLLPAFMEAGNYQGGQLYKDFLTNWKGQEALEPFALDLAVLALGNNDISEAKAFLELEQAVSNSEDTQSLQQKIDDFERLGYVPIISDRHGNAIAVYQLDQSAIEFVAPDLFHGWAPSPQPTREALMPQLKQAWRQNTIETTLDINLQRAARQAMRGYNGTMVLTEPQSGQILAAYATEGFNPFQSTFEPGSVIKLLTYGIFLEQGGDVSTHAPKRYAGNQSIGGKIFYDWTTQGQLDTVEEGMAVSCNLMFANMGIEAGWPALHRGIQNFFDGRDHGLLLQAGQYGHLVDQPNGVWEVGRSAIGLDFIAATSYGLAMMTSAIAADGKLAEPYLVARVLDPRGQTVAEPKQEAPQQVFSSENAKAIQKSMVAAVYDDRGTARRAKTSFVRSAMKTGTAGDRPFDAIMVGFLPADQPKLAFALYLSKGGKCEINGAKVAKQLQEQLRALAPSYLE